MGTQLDSEAVRLAIGQQVNDSAAFQIYEDGAVSLTSLPGPVVHPEHTRRGAGRRRCATADEAEQGRAAYGRADPLGQARAGLAAQRKADVVLQAPSAAIPPAAQVEPWAASPRRAVRWA